MPAIGSLTADLKLESAAFIRDLKKAADATARNTSAMKRQMAGLQTSFSAAASTFKGFVAGFASVATVRSIANISKAVIDLGDEIATSATKIGIAGEELQRLRFAAGKADVEISELDNALKIFQKNIATGKLEPQGFQEFIQRIREAPDQLEKVRVAQEGLGKQFQIGLLLAAQSGEEFRRNYESARVVSEQALKVAGDLDNVFKDIGNSIQAGFATGFLDQFNKSLGVSKEGLEAIERAARGLGAVTSSLLVAVSKATLQTIEDIRSLRDFWLSLPAPLQALMTGNFAGAGAALGQSAFGGITASGSAGAGSGLDAAATGIAKIAAATKTAAPEVDKLKAGLAAAGAEAANMGAVHQMSADQLIQGWLSVADVIGGAMGQLFEDNKAVAVAQALINVAQGVTAALAQYPPPLSFAMAAAQAAAGAVQIATIKSTKPGSNGSVKRPAAGGGSGRAVSKVSSEPPSQQRAIFVNLQGSGRYTRDEVFSLIEQLVEAQKDGAQLVLSQP